MKTMLVIALFVFTCDLVSATSKKDYSFDNEYYTDCGTACPLTCDNYQNPPDVCITLCVEGCFCDTGYVRAEDGQCVQPKKCPTKIPICEQPKVVGPCKAAMPRFYYNKSSRECEPFTYGGCQGNQNNFLTYEECSGACIKKPVPVCDQPLVVGPCAAAIKRYYYDEAAKKCRSFSYGGCEGNQNNFVSLQDCQTKCVSPCEQPKDSGPCFAYFLRYFYNKKTKKCEEFIFGGCKGNNNKFETLKECEKMCVKKSVPPCDQPKDSGPCFASEPRYFYNKKTKKCKKFVYGGCEGNQNNFETLKECKKMCVTKSVPPCEQPKNSGPCFASEPRYFYNKKTNKCKKFVYGGCGGNQNNFETLKKCKKMCVKKSGHRDYESEYDDYSYSWEYSYSIESSE